MESEEWLTKGILNDYYVLNYFYKIRLLDVGNNVPMRPWSSGKTTRLRATELEVLSSSPTKGLFGLD